MQYSKWVSLPLSTRIAIVKQFGIAKNRSTHVVNDYVQDDGYNVKDVDNALTVKSIQAFLNSDESDFETLWAHFIEVMEGRRAKIEPEAYVPTAMVEEEPKKVNKPVAKKKK